MAYRVLILVAVDIEGLQQVISYKLITCKPTKKSYSTTLKLCHNIGQPKAISMGLGKR